MSLDAPEKHASSDVSVPISLSQAEFYTSPHNNHNERTKFRLHGVTGTLKHVKSSVARSGGIVLRWSSGYGVGG